MDARRTMRAWPLLGAALLFPAVPARAAAQETTLYVSAEKGSDRAPGSRRRPLKTLSAALALVPEIVEEKVVIEILGGVHETTGAAGMPAGTLELQRRMRPGVTVTLLGRRGRDDALPVLAWSGGRAMVDVREGDWRLENVQLGSGDLRQRRGVMVAGPAHITLKDLVVRTRSQSDAGIYAHHGGRVSLRGAIRLNEQLHEEAGEETFCGIIATDHATVRFVERDGAFLDMGNGSLSASYYGCIRLGCEWARITSWGEQSNNLAVNDSGRIDLHGTTVTLRAPVRRNTPIGLEDDGHILAEDAVIRIEGSNDCAIALQKASTLACNDIALDGDFPCTIWASSGSMFVGRFLSDVTAVDATTGAGIHIEKYAGELLGPVRARHGGIVSLPDRVVRSTDDR